LALALYEKRRRRTVFGLQDGSRTMFGMATTQRSALDTLRDAAFRLMPEGMMLADIERSMVRPI
jgi:2-polyprenyl-6-methoxyphenol hydroxylase-like FAD-dependent oxidoreductase